MQRLALRPVFALTAAGLSLLATLAVALLVGRETSNQLRHVIGADLSELAHQLANNLDRGLFERWRDIQVAAAIDTLTDPNAPSDAKRTLLERMRSTYPDYAFIGLTGPDGRFQTTTLKALDGLDVQARAYFVEGRRGPFVGDVHDAVLLANFLGPAGRDPPRFVDLAAPLYHKDGSFQGIVVAHLDWGWADEMQRSLLGAAGLRHPDIEVLVLARDGTVLLGPKDLLRTHLGLVGVEAARSGASGSSVETWPDGQQYLSGYHKAAGYRDYPGLGWSILVRERAELSFASVGALQRRIAVWGALVALCSALLAWLAAGWISRPLRALALAAEQLGGEKPVSVPVGVPKEIAQVGKAMSAASEQLMARERRQALLIAELNHRVKNTLATVQAMTTLSARGTSDVATYRRTLEGRLLALSKTHNLLTEVFWDAVTLSDLLRSELVPYDDATGTRSMLDGPPVRLAPRVAVALGMAFHELTTNAVKFGGLSLPEGHVEVRWSVVSDKDGKSRLWIDWREIGSPNQAQPGPSGFGSRLIRQSIAHELDGEVRFEFVAQGLNCVLSIPLPMSDVLEGAGEGFVQLRVAA